MKRQPAVYTVGDRTLTVKEWAKVAGMPAGNLYNRLGLGWTMEEAISEPVYTHGGARTQRALKRVETHRVTPEGEGSYVEPVKSEKQIRIERANERIEEEIRKLRALVTERAP